MRGPSLQTIKARVERLAASADVAGCDGNHWPVKVSFVWGDDEAEKWPPPGSPSHCGCGAELEYSHVVHQFEWAHAGSAVTAPPDPRPIENWAR